ncbi:hypothetical protein UlMin_039876, partial [Ulmus minor]
VSNVLFWTKPRIFRNIHRHTLSITDPWRFFANRMAWQRRYRGTNHQWSYGESSYIVLLFLVRFLDQWTICNLKYKLTRLLLKQLENLNFEVRTSEGLEAHNHGILQEKQILMGQECLSIDGSDDYVTVTASFSKDGKYWERNFKCNILVGADGAGSTVRKLVGIDMKGEKELQKLVSVHFLSRVFGQYLLNERPGMLIFIFNTEAIGVLVAHDRKQGEFVFQISVPFELCMYFDFLPSHCRYCYFQLRYPPQQNIEDFSPKLILKLVGRQLGDIKVVDIKPWVMHAEVAEKFLCLDNRLILVGDAAHRFPPAGGFASIVQGIAPFSILTTYETERRPRAILNGIFTIARAKLSESILNEYNPLGWSRLAKLRRIFEEGRSLQLQFPADFRYLEGMVVPDSVSAPQEAPSGRRRDYIPTADPGCRLPHMTVMVFSSSSSKETISTPDLISIDNVEFLLIIAPKASSYHLARASLTVAEELKVPIKVCIIWSSDPIEGTKAPLAPCKNYIDVLEVRKSPTLQSWWDVCKMSEKGAILVRPDEHIAWRAKSEVFGDPSQEMTGF